MKSLAFILLGALLLAALFFVLRETAPTGSAETVAPAPAVVAAQPDEVIELVIKNKQRISGPEVIRVAEGTSVTIRVAVDADDEFHLHGYDREARLRPGQPATIRFIADRSGRFEYELHHSHVTLGVLEVMPR